MYCKNCGKKLNDNAKFCTYCGIKIDSENPAPTDGVQNFPSQFDSPQESDGSGSSPITTNDLVLSTGSPRRKGLIFGVIAAAVVVCVGVGIAIFNIWGSSPQTKVEKAMEKTLSAYSNTVKDMGFSTLTQLQEKKSYSTDFSVALKELPADMYSYYDVSVLEGLGMRIGTDFNLENRAMAVSLAAFYGSEDLMQGAVSLDDTVMTAYSPELLGDSALGIDTMTLGSDLADLDPDNRDQYKDISFNLYDFLDKYSQIPEMDPEVTEDLRGAIEVEETGNESVEINGTDMDCMGYSVLIPEDALRDYLDAVEDMVDDMELEDTLIDLLESIGVPQDELSYIEQSIKDTASVKELFNALDEAVKAMGDVELQMYLKDGYVMAIEWEPKIESLSLEIGLYLGGGKVYEDQWSLVISSGRDEWLVESEGDHTASSGRYTDTTTITYRSAESVLFELESELEYEPKAESDNFYWSIEGGDGFSMYAEGQLTSGKDTLTLALDNLEFQSYGETMLVLEMDYTIRPYEKRDTGAKDVKMISDLSRSELEDLGWEIQSNIQNEAYDLLNKIPALQGFM